MRRVDEKLVEPVLDPDWHERGALVGTLADDGEERIVALGNYVRLRDPALAESAFVVADELQGRGIGTRLLEQLAARAASAGIERFVAEMAAGNTPMLGVFRAVGFEVARKSERGETEVRFPITPTEGFRARVEERDLCRRCRIAHELLQCSVSSARPGGDLSLSARSRRPPHSAHGAVVPPLFRYRR